MWWVWLTVAVLAAIGEVLTFDLFLACVAAAAVIVAVLAVLFVPAALQVGAFAALSLGGIVFVRPALKHALGIESRHEDTHALGHSSIIGRRAIVTRTVDGSGGQVRIGEGEFWSARSFDPDETVAVGESVEVLLVDGLTVLVEHVPARTIQSTEGAALSGAPSEKGN